MTKREQQALEAAARALLQAPELREGWVSPKTREAMRALERALAPRVRR